MKLILNDKTIATKATAKDIEKLDFTKSVLLEKSDGQLQWFVDDDDDSIRALVVSAPDNLRQAEVGVVNRVELAKYFKAYLKGDLGWMRKFEWENPFDEEECDAVKVKMKLNLLADQRKFTRYVKQRIRDYPVYINPGPGNDEDPVALVTVGFYAEQGGYVNVVFDTRPKADIDGEWTLHIDNETNTLPFPKWLSAYETVLDGHAVEVTQPDGTVVILHEGDGDDGVNRVFGEMLADTMLQLRDDGTLAKLPLAPKAFMVVEEFDGRYSWPPRKTRKTRGRIQTSANRRAR